MAKKGKGKNTNKKKNQNKNKTGDADPTDLEIEAAADLLGFSEEQKQQIKENAKNKKNQGPEEEEFESTEDKARSDMEQCEKLIGIKGSIDKTYEERKQQLEEAKERILATMQDREREEMKRINKKYKKQTKEGELVFFDKRSSGDKKLKALYDLVMRTLKELQAVKETKFDMIQRADKLKNDVEVKNKNIDKIVQSKHMLNNLFQTLKEKNIEAYRAKDQAIKDQQQAKKDMTKMFEKEIDAVTVNYQSQLDIKADYEKKKQELEGLAEEYKGLKNREKQMNEQHTIMNSKIDKELKSLMDNFNTEKSRYDKLTTEREQINNQYKDLKDKFQKYLAAIEASDGKIKTYAVEIEKLQKKIENTHIENARIKENQDETLQQLNSTDHCISSLKVKIDTFKNLRETLQNQVIAQS